MRHAQESILPKETKNDVHDPLIYVPFPRWTHGNHQIDWRPHGEKQKSKQENKAAEIRYLGDPRKRKTKSDSCLCIEQYKSHWLKAKAKYRTITTEILMNK